MQLDDSAQRAAGRPNFPSATVEDDGATVRPEDSTAEPAYEDDDDRPRKQSRKQKRRRRRRKSGEAVSEQETEQETEQEAEQETETDGSESVT